MDGKVEKILEGSISRDKSKSLGASGSAAGTSGAAPLVYSVIDEDLGVITKRIQDPGVQVVTSAQAPQETTADSASFSAFFAEYAARLSKVLSLMDTAAIEGLVQDLFTARRYNRQIFVFGNGGSAATASHLVNDLAKQRHDDERLLFRAISLTDNFSWVSATANDMGYDSVFTQQLKNLLQPQDLVIAISSSGNSPNILRALEYANSKGALTYAIVGFTGGKAAELAQRLIYIPTLVGEYGYMEDVTSILGHMITLYVERTDSAES